jgi:predicted P-loop ATPase
VTAKPNTIEVTLLRKSRGIISKRISLIDGKVVSDGSACAMGHGRAERRRVDGLAGLARLIESLSSNEALALGALRADLADEVAIATKAEIAASPQSTAVSRSADNISYRAGEPAPILHDFDTKDMPAHVARRVEDAGGFWPALVSICSGLAGAAHVVRPSTSSGLSNADTGETYPGSAGVHDYIEGEDGSDAVRYLQALHDRAWLAGLGWYALGKDGKLLERSIVDRMVGQGERLVFEDSPLVEAPLRQDAARRRPKFFPGGRVDTRAVCPSLTTAEAKAKAALLAEEVRRVEPERKQVREAYLDAEARKLVGHRKGMTLAEARAAVEKRIGGVLVADQILPWDDPDATATVGDVLDHPEAFAGETLADPIEGVEYGTGKATVMIGRDGIPFIHSFAHGGGVYRLCYDARAIRERIEKASDKPDALARLLLAADVDAVEEELLVKEVARAARVGVRAVRAKIKEVREERNQRGSVHGLELDRNGRPIANQRNIRRALELLGVGLRYDEFNDQVLVEGFADRTVVADDAIVKELWLLIEERYRFLSTRDFFFTVVEEAAHRNPFHPVRDYLDGLAWDGVPRLDRWLVDYGGADATEYVCAVGALTLVAAVRRVRQPGCKFDEMLILENPLQGTDKSTTLKVLAVREEWYSDDLPLNSDGKRVIEQTRGKWIVEASELSGMRRSDVEHHKAMLSRTSDRARLSYDRLTTDRPRQFIIIGTTNPTRYLKDTTGNRRFWPVAVGVFDLVALARDLDQLWAEAAAREATGASIRLDPKLYTAAGEEQEKREIADPWCDLIGERHRALQWENSRRRRLDAREDDARSTNSGSQRALGFSDAQPWLRAQETPLRRRIQVGIRPRNRGGAREARLLLLQRIRLRSVLQLRLAERRGGGRNGKGRERGRGEGASERESIGGVPPPPRARKDSEDAGAVRSRRSRGVVPPPSPLSVPPGRSG